MSAKFFFLLVLLLSTVGCNKEDENIETNLDGDYIGIFERSESTSNVELTLNNGSWNGESEIPEFPALCNGTYSITGGVINFENACFWTADFDWSLILSDNWNYNLNTNRLILTKTNGDRYTLTKQ